MPGALVDELFFGRQQISKHGRQAGLVEQFGDMPVARAEAAAAAAMREQHHALCRLRQGQVGVERGTAGGDPQRLAACRLGGTSGSIKGCHVVSWACSARASSSRTSSSLVCEKSSYHNPTARNGRGVLAHTTSSASRRSC